MNQLNLGTILKDSKKISYLKKVVLNLRENVGEPPHWKLGCFICGFWDPNGGYNFYMLQGGRKVPTYRCKDFK